MLNFSQGIDWLGNITFDDSERKKIMSHLLLKGCKPFFVYTLLFCLQINCSTKKCCNNLKYFSIAKWIETEQYDFISDSFNFYRFQTFLGSNFIVTKSYNSFLEIQLINENKLRNYLYDIYKVKGYSNSLDLLEHIDKLNLNYDRDSAILLLDLNDHLTLLSLGSKFSTKAWGSGFTGRENYLLNQSKDTLSIVGELPQGILRGVYVDNNCLIQKLIFEDYKNSYNDKKYHNGEVMFELDLTDTQIKFSKIMNVRKGEPLDFNDKKNYFKEIENFVYNFQIN